MRYLAIFGRFWWDFIAGDDWRVAAGVLVALAAGALLTATSTASDAVVAMVVTAGIVGAVAVTLHTSAGPR
jgi:hypothetical protein